ALEDHSGEHVSGLLLLCPSYICHVVEVTDKNSLLYFGMEFTLFPRSALLQEIKVLVVAHNIPTRLFPDWYVAIATSPVASPQGSTQSDSTAEVVADSAVLGKFPQLYLCHSPVLLLEDADESVHTLEPELLIPAETINYLCNAEECTSPEDFLRIYLSPSQPVLDSETVWPVPSHFSV
uniref:Uncharacterized protein n=1 Tax=Calidris pygmaea TaxID=425635 RepID=A0A8C3KA31_9CHAR